MQPLFPDLKSVTPTSLRQDLFGGMTAAIVALPLALAFGVASGLGPTAGLYGAIVVGFFAALFGGTPQQISGPTGPLTVVIAGLAVTYGHNPDMLFSIVMLAGIIQALFGIFRLGAYVNYVPLPVVSGFMSGIGCIIIIMELLPVLGDYSPHQGIPDAIQSLPHAFVAVDISSLTLGALALGITLITPRRLSQLIPASLLALVIGTIVGATLFPELKTIGEISTRLPELKRIEITFAALPGMITGAFMLALLASIDSLLTSTVADRMTRRSHQSDRELIGQGVANMLAGLVGGLPGAGATMRTVVNIKAGAQSRLSGIVHAIVLLLIVAFGAELAAHIPLAVLAGILLKVGFDIIDWDFIRRLGMWPRDKIFLMSAVLVLTVFSDLVTAIGLGLILSHMIYSRRLGRSQLQQIRAFEESPNEPTYLADVVQVETPSSDRKGVTLHLSGHLSYAITKDLTRLISEALEQYDKLTLDMEDVLSMDLSLAVTLEEILQAVPEKHRSLHLRLREGETQKLLNVIGLFKHIPAENLHVIAA
ncbi:SulP family inorganic anion transporter [Luteithermobacter gelatinilyticus]|uniref:SulP family inorganic anion transporter n=1 Tax=Luteithermobacter gelatinilyticus TaxID=2582913 RepID=UPI00110667FA|nr:SulP family inorganic anion transporter [Luteithermobacter gelatinilyticus]